MHIFVRQLITEWRRLDLPFNGESIIVAVSGGADSTSLLLALADLHKRKKLEHEFIVAHFNHKLRSRESDGDEKFVRSLAEQAMFQFKLGKSKRTSTSNIEESARNDRYEFLLKTANKTGSRIVLMAHTLNDQAETVLMNLIRGSGVDGLTGMRRIRPLEAPVNLVRPMLGWAKRSDTVKFCKDTGIEPRIDKMNLDTRFTRVRIRTEVIPMIEKLNPKIVETLAQTADLLRPGVSERESSVPDTLRLSDIQALTSADFKSAIRSWLREKRGNLRGLQLKHIMAIERLVKSPKSGRIAELPGGEAVVKGGGRLAFRDNKLEN